MVSLIWNVLGYSTRVVGVKNYGRNIQEWGSKGVEKMEQRLSLQRYLLTEATHKVMTTG